MEDMMADRTEPDKDYAAIGKEMHLDAHLGDRGKECAEVHGGGLCDLAPGYVAETTAPPPAERTDHLDHTPPRVYYKVERNTRGVTWATHVEAAPGVAEPLMLAAVAWMEERYGAIAVEQGGGGDA